MPLSKCHQQVPALDLLGKALVQGAEAVEPLEQFLGLPTSGLADHMWEGDWAHKLCVLKQSNLCTAESMT